MTTTGIKPSPRDKHSAVVWQNKIIIFGGFGPATEADNDSDDEGDAIKFTWFNDTFIFDTITNSWDAPNITTNDGPVSRAAHSATIYNNKMIVFGGKDSKARNQVIITL